MRVETIIATVVAFILWPLPQSAAQSGQSGNHGDGHAEMHSSYKDWKDRHGFSCCDNADCRPTRVCELGEHLGVIADGRCVAVPASSLLRIPSPDGRTHLCMPAGSIVPRCVVIGEPRS